MITSYNTRIHPCHNDVHTQIEINKQVESETVYNELPTMSADRSFLENFYLVFNVFVD